jgi:16S rRNA (guanine527-N7)-methyltransferase
MHPLRAAAATLGLDLSDPQLAAFAEFEDRLYAANEVMNLTRVPREDAWRRHFLDSLLFHDLIPEGAEVLDIGAGPGFPAWPLACARPDLEVTALDSNGKMLGFLKENLLPNLRSVQVRAEEWGMRDRFDVVTGRAVAPLAAQLEISAPPCRVGGLVLPMRTARDEPDLERVQTGALGLELRRVERRVLPGEEAERLFPVYEKTTPTAPGYPRRWAEIKAKPLIT